MPTARRTAAPARHPPAKPRARAPTPAPPPKLPPVEVPDAPAGFEIERLVELGRHPLLEVFPGLDRLDTAERQVPDAASRRRLFAGTFVEIVDDDVWMYVAPWKIPRIPKRFRRRWNPVSTPNLDCIVIGASHLRKSPALILYLDIYHELCHILQRQDGANLWEPGLGYVERRTEIEAYRFVVEEAKSLGVTPEYLREYLKVEWISAKEHAQLLAAVGVPAPARARAARRG